MKPEQRRFWGVWILLALLGLALAVGRRSPATTSALAEWSGTTMGTTYTVKIVPPPSSAPDLDDLRARVEAELLAVNQAMSTYLADSEICRFNRWERPEPFPVGEGFDRVLRRARELHAATGGAFEPTLGPLIDLWGFGAAAPPLHEPDAAVLRPLLARIGMDKLRPVDGGWRKDDPLLNLNLSAIAKGYGVDRVSELLHGAGYSNTYVEIGGEVVCRGVNASGVPWRIGIQVPDASRPEGVMRIVPLDNRALATSGDYQNYREIDGRVAHHILDPRNGRPARHDLTSVSVLADDCMTADALATALFVMGADEGMAWVRAHEGVEALFIRRGPGGFRVEASPGFPTLP